MVPGVCLRPAAPWAGPRDPLAPRHSVTGGRRAGPGRAGRGQCGHSRASPGPAAGRTEVSAGARAFCTEGAPPLAGAQAPLQNRRGLAAQGVWAAA